METGAPDITVSIEAGQDVPKRTVKFQCGLLRETETFVGEDVEMVCRESLQEYVCDMLNVKVSWSWVGYVCVSLSYLCTHVTSTYVRMYTYIVYVCYDCTYVHTQYAHTHNTM